MLYSNLFQYMVAQFDRIDLATVHFYWRVIDNVTVSINGGLTSNAYFECCYYKN